MSTRSVGKPPRRWLRCDEAEDPRLSEKARKAARKRAEQAFGDEDLNDGDWEDPTDETDRGFIDAAKVQHRVGQSLHSIIRRTRGMTVAKVGEAIDMSEDGVYRVLNGAHHLYLTDLVRIASHCGWDVQVKFKKRPETDATEP